jgi:hypothetical protein
MAAMMEKRSWQKELETMVKKLEWEMSAVYNTQHPVRRAPPPADTVVAMKQEPEMTQVAYICHEDHYEIHFGHYNKIHRP